MLFYCDLTVTYLRLCAKALQIQASNDQLALVVVRKNLPGSLATISVKNSSDYDAVVEKYVFVTTVVPVSYARALRTGLSNEIFFSPIAGVSALHQCELRKREKIACNENNCGLAGSCGNFFRRQPDQFYVSLVIAPSTLGVDAGLGVFIDQDLQGWERICTYCGVFSRKLVSESARAAKKMRNYTFTFCKGFHIDASEVRGVGGYVNSAATRDAANCCYDVVFLAPKRAVCVLYSKRALRKGEELLAYYEFFDE
jgi:hypothetical protein